MKVLFFFANNLGLRIFMKIQAELLMNHVLNNDEIYIVKDFEQNIGKSQVSYYNDNLYYIKKSFYKLISFLKSKGGNIHLLDYKKVEDFHPQAFENIEELKEFSFNGCNLGLYVASSMISIFRDHKLNTKKYYKYINRELKNSIEVLKTIECYHNEIHPDLVYLFNGRMAVYAPIVFYCRKEKIPFKTFETTFSYSKYYLAHNNTSFDIKYHHKEMMELWNSPTISEDEKIKIGVSFFENQRQGINEIDPSYITLQKKELNSELIKGKEVISFFNSSIDEFASVPGWENYIYLFDDETKAIEEICNHYVNDKNKIFILRIHPNLKHLDNSQNRELLKLKTLENLIVIEPHSPIRSYSLLEKSNKIITFGSTIGVESCYYGKPIICLGMSYYNFLEVAYIPKNKEELYSYIDNKNLSPKPKENALIYGYWARTFGEPFTNFINKTISEEDYALTSSEKLKGFLLKFLNINNYKRLFKIFNPKYNFKERLKNPTYRKNVLRLFIPWKIK